METRDLVITPIWLIIIYVVAYAIRPRISDEVSRQYFFPALTVKIFGALAVGLIYQFYYGGGDTFNYHTYGSRHVWEAFMDSPVKWAKLVFGDGIDESGIYKYTSRIAFWKDPSSYAIVRVAGILDVLTFSTYSATALLFAVFSFIGMWLLYLTFYGGYPHLHKQLAIVMFFIPSVFFWGSGLLKDTLTLGCLGMATYGLHRTFVWRKFSTRNTLLLLIGLVGLYQIKIYILLVFLPAAIVWLFLSNLESVQSLIAKAMLLPIVILGALALAYFAMIKVGQDNARYSVDSLAKTAQSTAYDIRYYTGKDAGSGYSLGELDGSMGSMLRLAPQAINVSLFRPYLWEVNNPLMLLSALESTFLMLFALLIVFRENVRAMRALSQPDVLFALIFAFTFAFAVGVSTYNFGTLVRYKIPMLPFFALALILISDYSKSARNVAVFELTE